MRQFTKEPQPVVHKTIEHIGSMGYYLAVDISFPYLGWHARYPEFISFDNVVWC